MVEKRNFIGLIGKAILMSPRSNNESKPPETIPRIIQTANKCIVVARRNRKPLTGNNTYAHKFLELSAQSVLLSKNLKQQLAGEGNKDVQSAVEETIGLLETFFVPTTTERPEIQKRILFLYKSIIEPALVDAPVYQPKGELFPLEIVKGTRDYIEEISQQANGCFENGWYDACAVMLRRLLETLIIECYEYHSIADSIKGKDGNFLYLRDLIDRFVNETTWNPSRNTRLALPKLKEIGDLSAHSRRYIAKKPDITNLQRELRVVIQELVYLVNLYRKAG